MVAYIASNVTDIVSSGGVYNISSDFPRLEGSRGYVREYCFRRLFDSCIIKNSIKFLMRKLIRPCY